MKKRARRKMRLDVALKETQTPLFVLDEQRTVVFFNDGCEQLTGWQAADVVGLTAVYRSDDQSATDRSSINTFVNGLCPPPNVLGDDSFSTGELAVVPAAIAHKNGDTLPRLLNFFPLKNNVPLEKNAANNTAINGHVLGIITEIEQPLPTRVTPAQQLHAELAAVRNRLRQRYQLSAFIGSGESMRRVVRQIDIARQSVVPVALCGESGTGKEHVARLIHHESEQRIHSFVPIDCQRLPAREIKPIFERIFDHEASPSLPSLRATTLFLSHVELLSRDLQQWLVELLRTSSNDSSPNIRIIVATTGNLHEQFSAELFRPDFYYLLTSLEISLPPLRERADEFSLHVQSFLEAGNRDDTLQIGGCSSQVLQQLTEYRWPGNLTELNNVITESRQLAEARTDGNRSQIELDDLPFRFRTGLDAQTVGPPIRKMLTMPLDDYLARIETEQIMAALEQSRNNKTEAAQLLGLTRPAFYRRIKSLGISDVDEPTKS